MGVISNFLFEKEPSKNVSHIYRTEKYKTWAKRVKKIS